jgi:hypothetical protein
MSLEVSETPKRQAQISRCDCEGKIGGAALGWLSKRNPAQGGVNWKESISAGNVAALITLGETESSLQRDFSVSARRSGSKTRRDGCQVGRSLSFG